jgi:uncharacterized protein YegP (UPF0339 family)
MPEKPTDQKLSGIEAERRSSATHPYFEIYRANEVSLTSTLFGGGDWRWRLCAAAGVVTANGGGYSTESACKSAVAALRSAAQSEVIVAA